MSIRIWLVALLVLFLGVTALAQQQPATPPTGVISEIKIVGNQHVSNDAILSRMAIKVGQPYDPSQLDKDRDSIDKLGFFKAVDVHAAQGQGNNWIVTVDVSEFPIVKEFRITGNTVVSDEAIRRVITIRPGLPFNQNDQLPTGAAIEKLYLDKGYFALVTDASPLEESPGTINIAIQETKVNSVGVEGNVRTKNSVMRKLIKTKPGEAYNTHKWDDDLKRLYAIGWFDKVDPQENLSPDQSNVDLLAVVKEARTGQASVGVSLSPETGLAGQATLADKNFNGTGQSVGITFMQAITGGGPSVSLNYGNPFVDNHDTSFSASVYSQLLYRFTGSGLGELAATSSQLYTERHTGFFVGFGRPLQPQVTAQVGLRAEDVLTQDVQTSIQSSFIEQDGTVGTLPMVLTRDRRDLALDPSRGDLGAITVTPGIADIDEVRGAIQNTSILGTHTFDTNTIEYRTYFTNQPPRGRNIDAPRRVLALRVKYGFITGFAPFFQQFFVGGADTLRGYDDDRFWGTQELISSLEFRYPIQKSFDLVPFFDYGGAWGGYGTVNQFYQNNSFRLHYAYGIGVRFRTPLGLIGIDFGINEFGGNRTTFSIGNPF